MRKVLIFSTAYFPFVGGAEVAVKEITDRIKDIEFDLITSRTASDFKKTEKVGNINIYRVGPALGFLDKFLLPFFGFLKARELDKEKNYDIIWSIMASQASVAASFFKVKNPRKKLVLTLQEGDEEEYLKRYVFGIDVLYKYLIKPWHVMVFKKADHITAISDYLKKRAEGVGIKAPVEIIPNGVDLENFQKPVGVFALSAIYNFLKIDIHDKVAITVSRLVKKNAIEDIVDAMAFLPDNAKLLILGSGELEKELKDRANDYKLRDKIRFLSHVIHGELPQYLKIACVFVRPSLSEGLGNSFLEAMAAGVPVIGTNVGGIPDFLKDGETGLFCEVKNPKSIAEKVNKIFDDEQLRQKLIKNGKELVEKNYNWELIAQKMKNVFEKLK